jgi:chromosome segregation ATPase
MRDNVLCSKIKFEKKSDENERLTNEYNEIKKLCDRFEQENQKLKLQIEYERKKVEESTKLKTLSDIELQNIQEKLRTQRYEHETKIATLDESLKYSQKQHQTLQQNQRTIEDKHEKEIHDLKQHIHELENKIEEVIKDKALASIRCGELIEENRKLEKALIDKEDDYEEKIAEYRKKNSFLSTQIEDIEKKLTDTKKQLDFITIEKDETLADMLIAVRVASEMRHGIYSFVISERNFFFL